MVSTVAGRFDGVRGVWDRALLLGRCGNTLFLPYFDSEERRAHICELYPWREVKLMCTQGHIIEAIPDPLETHAHAHRARTQRCECELRAPETNHDFSRNVPP